MTYGDLNASVTSASLSAADGPLIQDCLIDGGGKVGCAEAVNDVAGRPA